MSHRHPSARRRSRRAHTAALLVLGALGLTGCSADTVTNLNKPTADAAAGNPLQALQFSATDRKSVV